MRSVVAAALLLVAAGPAATQSFQPFIPVGVVVPLADGVLPDPRDLQSFSKSRFNVVASRDAATRELRVNRIVVPLPPDPAKQLVPIPTAGVAVVSAETSSREIRFDAWHAVAKGARGVVFDPAEALRQNEEALDAASAFADNLARNAALFAPLRPRADGNDVRVEGAVAAIDARFLESSVAFVLIAVNQTPDVHRVTLKFSSDFPEAIWQNMETGAAVNFVASKDGATYTRTFTPFDVIVLMIRKQYK
jgi:hypothetical protein